MEYIFYLLIDKYTLKVMLLWRRKCLTYHKFFSSWGKKNISMPSRYLRNVPTYIYYVRNRNRIDPCNFTIFQPYRQFVAAIHFPFSAGFCWKCKAKRTVDGSVRFSRIIRRMRTTVSLQGSVRKDISHFIFSEYIHIIYTMKLIHRIRHPKKL